MTAIPVGVQLYSIRVDCARDLPASLEAVAKMGYDGVEFAGYHGYEAQELRKMLDSLGLKCCGTHIGLDQLLGESLPKTIEFNQKLGNKYLIVPWLSEEHRKSRAAWLDTAKLFNEIAERVRPYGMQVGYHNHHVEFIPLEGEEPFETFFSATTSDVIMQLDTGNAMEGGADPRVYLKRYPGRATTIHLKEYSVSNPVAFVGEGDVPWQEIFTLCESQRGTEWYIVEYEHESVPPLEAIARCRENLRKMGK